MFINKCYYYREPGFGDNGSYEIKLCEENEFTDKYSNFSAILNALESYSATVNYHIINIE